MYFELFAYVRTGRRPVAIGPEISKYMPREPRVHTTEITVNSPRPLLPLSVHLLGFRVLAPRRVLAFATVPYRRDRERTGRVPEKSSSQDLAQALSKAHSRLR